MVDETPPPLPSQPESVAAAPRTEPLAIWSLVLSILSWFGCFFLTAIPGIIFGHVARSRIRRSNRTLHGVNMAVAGLIIGYAAIPFGILGGIMLVDMIRSERVRLQELAVEKKEIASDDNKLKITTSGFWVKRTDLNKEAKLQTASPSEGMFVVVISESKADFPSLTLEKHHQVMREAKLRQMENASATEPVSLVVDGHPALQDELRGTENNTDVVFLHTTVDEGDDFDHIMAWTVKSRWQKHNQELRDVTNSFHSEK